MAKEQLTLDFEPGLSEQYQSALEVVRAGAYTRPMKGLAADMDMSQSELSRKLAQNEHDPRKFTLDDFERYLSASGDLRPLEYLIERFMASESDKQRRAMAQVAELLPKFAALMKQAGVS